MVGVLGLEPRSLAAQDFESSVFTNFTILPAWRRRSNLSLIYHCAFSESNQQINMMTVKNDDSPIFEKDS